MTHKRPIEHIRGTHRDSDAGGNSDAGAQSPCQNLHSRSLR